MGKLWLKEQVIEGNGTIRRLCGIVLLFVGICYIFIYSRIINDVLITPSVGLLTVIFSTAAALLGVGNITDIWKYKRGIKASVDTSGDISVEEYKD